LVPNYSFHTQVDLDSDVICENIKKLETYLDNCWKQRKDFEEKVLRYLYLVNGKAAKEVEIFLSKSHTFDEYKHAINKYHNIYSAILIDILPTENIGIFKIDYTEIINILHQRATTFKNNIITHMKSAYLAVGKK